ncbi:MAG: hypothetical protein IPF99_20135 [Deltaproteobacteria bacterium]|nr:hypothetical protein [Deltaproteobacteria bacterium]
MILGQRRLGARAAEEVTGASRSRMGSSASTAWRMLWKRSSMERATQRANHPSKPSGSDASTPSSEARREARGRSATETSLSTPTGVAWSGCTALFQ